VCALKKTGQEGDGVSRDTTADGQGKADGQRNKHRPPKKDRDDPLRQGTLPGTRGADGAGAGDDAESEPGADGERDERDGDDGGEGDHGAGVRV
jgi:hypothetical protein